MRTRLERFPKGDYSRKEIFCRCQFGDRAPLPAMRVAIILCFTVSTCFMVNSLGAAVSTRSPLGTTNNGMANRTATSRKPNQVQNSRQVKSPARQNGRSRAAQQTNMPRPGNAQLQNPNSPSRNADLMRRQKAKQQIPPKGGQLGTRQIPGIPAGPPGSDIDDKVVIDDGLSTIPTIIPPFNPSPTAPQQNTDETDEPTTTPPEPTPPQTEPPRTTISPQTTTTIAPQTTTTIAPQTTTTIAPQTTSTIAPQTTSTIAPQTTSTIAPQTTSTISPQTTTTIAPQTTTTIAPQTTTTIAPQTTTTIAPQTPAPTPPPTPCVPVPPQKSTVVYVPQPVVRYGYFRQPPPVKKPPPVVVVNNEISPGVPCPATATQTSQKSEAYRPNMIVVNNPKGTPQVPAMVYNNGRPPRIVSQSGK